MNVAEHPGNVHLGEFFIVKVFSIFPYGFPESRLGHKATRDHNFKNDERQWIK